MPTAMGEGAYRDSRLRPAQGSGVPLGAIVYWLRENNRWSWGCIVGRKLLKQGLAMIIGQITGKEDKVYRLCFEISYGLVAG